MKAAGKIVCVLVDCDWGRKNKDLTDKYEIRGYPTVVFTDPDGKEVGRLGDRSAAALLRQINDLASRYTRAAYAESWEKALAQAKAGSKPLVYVFGDGAALDDPSLREFRGNFVFVKGEIRGADAKRFGVTEPAILVLDPYSRKTELLRKISGAKSAAELRRELLDALKKFGV